MRKAVHVLLAGDKKYDRYLLEGKNTCLLDFSGRALVDLTLSAFSSSSLAKNLVVIGPSELESLIPSELSEKEVLFVKQRESLSENILTALETVEESWPGSLAIFVTNDAPLLTGAELDAFVRSTLELDVDINVAVSRINERQLQDPLVKEYIRSMVVLSDGLYLLANQVALSKATADLIPTMQRFFDMRKQSRLFTEVLTLVYALRRRHTRKAIAKWFRLITVKRLWRITAHSDWPKMLSFPLPDIESALGDLLDNRVTVRITEVRNAKGCFDADTVAQLKQLRTLFQKPESTTEPQLEMIHA